MTEFHDVLAGPRCSMLELLKWERLQLGRGRDPYGRPLLPEAIPRLLGAIEEEIAKLESKS